MYKLTDNTNIIVHIEERMTIHKGNKLWDDYEEWLAEGNIPAPMFTDEELNTEVVRKAKADAIKDARDNSGLKDITVEQAYAYIDAQFDGVTNATQAVVAIKKILKKMVPFILE